MALVPIGGQLAKVSRVHGVGFGVLRFTARLSKKLEDIVLLDV